MLAAFGGLIAVPPTVVVGPFGTTKKDVGTLAWGS